MRGTREYLSAYCRRSLYVHCKNERIVLPSWINLTCKNLGRNDHWVVVVILAGILTKTVEKSGKANTTVSFRGLNLLSYLGYFDLTFEKLKSHNPKISLRA